MAASGAETALLLSGDVAFCRPVSSTPIAVCSGLAAVDKVTTGDSPVVFAVSSGLVAVNAVANAAGVGASVAAVGVAGMLGACPSRFLIVDSSKPIDLAKAAKLSGLGAFLGSVMMRTCGLSSIVCNGVGVLTLVVCVLSVVVARGSAVTAAFALTDTIGAALKGATGEVCTNPSNEEGALVGAVFCVVTRARWRAWGEAESAMSELGFTSASVPASLLVCVVVSVLSRFFS